MNWRITIIKKLLKGMDLVEKHEILTMAVRKFFNTISADDILREDRETKQWFFQGKLISTQEVKQLQVEAFHFMESKLWKVLEADTQYQANKRMFLDSRSENDMIAGKCILFTLDIWKTRLNRMKDAIKKLPTG